MGTGLPPSEFITVWVITGVRNGSPTVLSSCAMLVTGQLFGHGLLIWTRAVILPLITHTVMNSEGGKPVPMVDLIVSDIYWVPSSPSAGISPRFYATVSNVGTADAEGSFWVELYIKPHPSQMPWGPADHDRGYCLNDCATLRPHYVGDVPGGLAAGHDVLVPFENLEPSPDFPAEGTYDIYVQVDVAFGQDNYYWAEYAEDDENNNVRQETLILGPSRVYLPLVLKNRP